MTGILKVDTIQSAAGQPTNFISRNQLFAPRT